MSKELVEKAKSELDAQKERDIVSYVKERLEAIQKQEDKIEEAQEKIAEERKRIEAVESGDYEDIGWTASVVAQNDSGIYFNKPMFTITP